MVAASRYVFSFFKIFTVLSTSLGMSVASRAQQNQQHPHHDIYSGLHENGRYQNDGALGLPCCGDDPINGDCEPVGSAFSILPNGDVMFTSQRYRATVLVARDKILWMTLRGGEFSEAHWCGKPRQEGSPTSYPSSINPDPAYFTSCAIISPRDM